MTRRTRILPGLIVAALAAGALVGCDVEPEPADTELDRPMPEQPPVTTDRPVGPQDQEVYEARLEERNGSGVSGTATFTLQGDELQVTVAATGLTAGTRVPQHIHLNASCGDAGGILLNLDADLSVAGEAEPRGDAYPESDDEGRLTYEASRSVEDLRTAMGDQGQTGASDLDLGNRVVNLHGGDMQPIACGAIDGTSQPQSQ